MIIVLNNKSNMTKDEYKNYLDNLSNINTNHKIVLCPTYLNIPMTNIDIDLGAQNVSATNDGAYTGEISAKQLKSYNVRYSIVGHSERRGKESLEEILNKINRLFENDITPILCIGETKGEREERRVEEVLEMQLLSAIENLTQQQQDKIIVAYEPVWSIGTGIIPTNEEITEVLEFIKKRLPNTRLLYGGSVNEENINIINKIPIIDGYLVGGLSLKPDNLKTFINKL